MSRTAVCIFLMFTSVAVVRAQTAPSDLRDLTLEELLEVKISVASRTALTARDSPSIVSVITRQEIADSGARDLRELLSLLVPGIHFGADVEGVVGAGVRGMWASEGKLLLLIDGIEANEGLFGTTQWGGHYPVETIERVEVIRGPGSAVYGGYAAVGVVNVITRGGDRFASATWSQMRKSHSKRGVAFGVGSANASLTGSWFEGMRSDRDHVDYFGRRRSLAGDSRLDSVNLNLHLQHRGVDFRAIVDRYDMTQFTLFGRNFDGPALDETFHSALFRLRYEHQVRPELKVIPRLEYARHAPWQLDVPEERYSNRKRVEKPLAGAVVEWTPREGLAVTGGIESYRNDVVMLAGPGPFEERLQSGRNRLRVSATGVFAQVMKSTPVAQFTIGGRYETTNEFGSAFVPRIAATRRFERLHLKAMAAQSFRVPAGILPNRIPPGAGKLQPEKATSYELEAGYRVGANGFVTVSLFDIGFQKVIVYYANPETGIGSYVNSGRFGSRGFEADFRYVGSRASLTANLASYRSTENNVAIYAVPGHSDHFLGFPPLRFNLLAGWHVSPSVSIQPSLSWFGERHGFTGAAADGSDVLRRFEPEALVNLHIRAVSVGGLPLEIDAGLRNLTDADVPFIQPYRGYAAPLPSESRAVVVRFEYTF
ncbi:MAG TPA: TonB-dependent receptor [Thermoanaerobaculia bacterium]|nr:TonB-dependent receptor [Thermoanaerobaculia bacterium]